MLIVKQLHQMFAPCPFAPDPNREVFPRGSGQKIKPLRRRLSGRAAAGAAHG